MVEKLIIENFAGIKYLEIEVKKINIMIGPQASGKSVCAKLLFYFKEFITELIKSVEDGQTKRQFDSSYSRKFKEYFPPKYWGDYDFKLKHEINDYFIQVSRYSKSSLVIDYSDRYRLALSKLRKNYQSTKKVILDPMKFNPLNIVDNRSDLMEIFEEDLGIKPTFVQYFIPAVRSFFSYIEKNVFSILSNQIFLDPFIIKFGKVYELMKSITHIPDFEDIYKKNMNTEIQRLVEKILCGKYIFENGEDFLEFADGRKIRISNCSSGQQETLPLVIILLILPFIKTIMPWLQPINRGQTIYIEEPEAHIFPTAQKSIVELMATVFNSDPDDLQFFITTHSPYILTATNNLLQAGLIYQEANSEVIEQLETIVPRYKALLTEDVAVYSLMDGSCQSIISEETGLIDTNIIDAVSEELAIEFDQLLELI